MLKQSVEIFVADTLTVIHLRRQDNRVGGGGESIRDYLKTTKNVAFLSLAPRMVTHMIFVHSDPISQSIFVTCGTYGERCGVRVEDVETEFLQSLFKHDVHHGVVLTVLCFQVTDLKKKEKL